MTLDDTTRARLPGEAPERVWVQLSDVTEEDSLTFITSGPHDSWNVPYIRADLAAADRDALARALEAAEGLAQAVEIESADWRVGYALSDALAAYRALAPRATEGRTPGEGQEADRG